MKTPDTATVGLLIQSAREHGSFRITVYPVRLDSEGTDTVRNFSGSSWDYDSAADLHNGFYLPDLLITALGDESRSDSKRELFGFELTYRPYKVTARSAARMAKTLTTFEKRMAKLYETRGHVRSFGEYVGRVAEILGVATIVKRPKSDAHCTMHSEGRYVRYTLGDGVFAIDGMERDWIEAGAQKAGAA